MNARLRFVLAAGVLGLLMTGPFVVTAVLIWADAPPAEREALLALISPRLPLGAFLTTMGFALGLLVLAKLFRQYVQGLLRMAETLRLMLSANRNFRVEPAGPPEVQQLAHAANTLAQQRDDLMRDVDAQIGAAKASLEEEKNRLAALMSELAQAVVVCNAEGRILLYNNRARLQFRALSAGPTSTAGGALIGLGRSIFSILERHQIEHALEVVRQRQAAGKAALANFITATRGGQLLRTQLVPVAAGQGDAGYVLTIENITRSLEQEAERDQVMHALTEGTRSALGNIRAAANNLNDYPEMDPVLRQRFLAIIGEEADGMSQRLDRTLHEFADSLQSRWPLEDVLAIDIAAAAARRIEERLGLPTKNETLDDSLWIRVDSYSLVLAMSFLAARLKDHYEIRELRFRLLAEGKFAYLDLIWAGSNVSSETFYTWELEPMQVGSESTALTLRDVINRHGGEIWYQREKAAHRAYFRFVLPLAVPEVAPPEGLRDEGRPEYYDFDLFQHRDASVDLDRPLAELAYTVFDTETTGLEPSNGDEIIQIGALRIVNQRLLRQERFEQLIDPRRPLRAESIAIHGITEDLLRGQPVIAKVLPAFHAFCEDTVLIAHNAAFDMRFLQLKEEATGVRFGQPVLDTLLLSAVVHPNQESHRLEAIAQRLGVAIGARHNALDDALATGEVFLKLLPLLAEMGIVTLRQALAAAEKTYYARVSY